LAPILQVNFHSANSVVVCMCKPNYWWNDGFLKNKQKKSKNKHKKRNKKKVR